MTEQEYEKICGYTIEQIPKEDLFTFRVMLCDNEIDRDFQQFSHESLEILAGLFLGKSGIMDHNPKVAVQSARIFETEVVRDESRVTRTGEVYEMLQAKAYMVRTKENSGLITEILAGIKKEVSIGCAMKRVECSVCGKNLREGSCKHTRGKVLDGVPVYEILKEPEDAYEWSFVVVPAQRDAGIMKQFSREENTLESLEGLVSKDVYFALAGQVEKLEKEAEFGRIYREKLQKKIVWKIHEELPAFSPELAHKILWGLSADELEMVSENLFQKAKPLQSSIEKESNALKGAYKI